MAKQKLNLIEELTTHKNEFQWWPLYPVQPIKDLRPREEPVQKPSPPFVQIDPQSHATYRQNARVPFDLYLSPKPIVGTDPRECFYPNESSQCRKYCPKKKAPTKVLSPALPLDEVEDEEDLRKILNFTYTGMHKILMNEAALKVSRKTEPPNRITTEGSDLRYKAQVYRPLPYGWIAAARHWDSMQNRNLGDPTKTFWERRGPEIECSCCCNPLPTMLPEDTREQIKQLICEDKLSVPYTVTKTGYGGYRPICAKGVPLEKS